MPDVQVVDMPDDFDPEGDHILVRRLGLRSYMVSGLVSHPHIRGVTRVPPARVRSRLQAIETAVRWAHRFELCAVYIDESQYPRPA